MWTNYSRMIISLPDVNIWIALAAEGHVHHVPARDWFAVQQPLPSPSAILVVIALLTVAAVVLVFTRTG